MNNSWFYMTGKFTLWFEPFSYAKMQQRQNELFKTCIFGLFKNSYFHFAKFLHRIYFYEHPDLGLHWSWPTLSSWEIWIKKFWELSLNMLLGWKCSVSMSWSRKWTGWSWLVVYPKLAFVSSLVHLLSFSDWNEHRSRTQPSLIIR